MNEPPSSDDTATTLAARAAALAGSVTELRGAVEWLDRRANRSRRVLAIAVAGLVLDLVLSVAVGFALLAQVETSKRQDVVQSEVLCPLYAIFIGSYRPESRTEGPDRQKYEEAFTVIRGSYAKLGCTGPPVPPAAR